MQRVLRLLIAGIPPRSVDMRTGHALVRTKPRDPTQPKRSLVTLNKGPQRSQRMENIQGQPLKTCRHCFSTGSENCCGKTDTKSKLKLYGELLLRRVRNGPSEEPRVYGVRRVVKACTRRSRSPLPCDSYADRHDWDLEECPCASVSILENRVLQLFNITSPSRTTFLSLSC